MSLEGDAAVLERGCFYVVPLLESLALGEAVLGAANPKSSTGRFRIVSRGLVADRGDRFDEVAPAISRPATPKSRRAAFRCASAPARD